MVSESFDIYSKPDRTATLNSASCSTEACTPALILLCSTALPEFLGLCVNRAAQASSSRDVRNLRSIFRRMLSPIAMIRPSQTPAAKPVGPSVGFTTTFGRNLGTAKRPSGYSSSRRCSVAVVRMWMGCRVEKNTLRQVEVGVPRESLGRLMSKGLMRWCAEWRKAVERAVLRPSSSS
jgi:hypothetical protein